MCSESEKVKEKKVVAGGSAASAEKSVESGVGKCNNCDGVGFKAYEDGLLCACPACAGTGVAELRFYRSSK